MTERKNQQTYNLIIKAITFYCLNMEIKGENLELLLRAEDILNDCAFKEKELKVIRDRLYELQCNYENTENYNEQSIRISQRIRALLDIYEQIIRKDRIFDENYLEKYL